MLIGQYEANIAEKNRVAIPKKFRTELGEQMVIARWYEKCLVIVSVSRWGELTTRVVGENKMVTASVRDTERFIMGSAFELTPDSQGRVVVPSALVKYANLKNELVFLGLGDRVEIWNKKDWLSKEEKIAESASALLESIADDQKGKDNA